MWGHRFSSLYIYRKAMNLIDYKITKYLTELIQNKNWHNSKWFRKVEAIADGGSLETWTIANIKDKLPKIRDVIQH